MQFLKKPEVRPVFIFLLIGILWIIVSDKFFLLTGSEFTAHEITDIQTIKGIVFVILVSLLLYFLILRSNKKFRLSEDEYSQLFNKNPTPMWIYDVETFGFLKVNKAAIEKYGYSAEEFYSMTIREIRPAEDVPKLESMVRKLSDVLSDSGIWRHKKKNGEVFSVHLTSHAFEFYGKQCRLALANDITDRQLLEASLLKTNNEMNVVLNSISDGFFIISKDFTILKSNDLLRKVAEIQTDDVVGKNFLEILPSLRNGTTHQHFVKALGTNQTIHFEKFCERRNSWFVISAYPIENVLSVFFRDITKEKESELRVIQNERNLNALINNTEDLIWSIDTEFRYHTFNEPYRRRYTQLFNDELSVGKLALSEVRGVEYMETWKALYKRALAGEVFTVDMEINVLDEGTAHVNTRFNPIFDSNKTVVGVGCFLQDITERKIHERKIEQQNKKLKDIAYITSHTVRAPLANLLGLIEAIDKTNLADPVNLKMLDYIKSSGEDLDLVIRDIVSQTVQLKKEESDQAS